jgi:hypothetical protein
MTVEPQEEIETISKKIMTFQELKTLTMHQDYIYKKIIVPGLNKLPNDIREEKIQDFNHYYRTNRNIIGYLWKEHLENKLIIDHLMIDKEVAAKVERTRLEIEEELIK